MMPNACDSHGAGAQQNLLSRRLLETNAVVRLKGVAACLFDMPPLPEHAERYVQECGFDAVTRTVVLERLFDADGRSRAEGCRMQKERCHMQKRRQLCDD